MRDFLYENGQRVRIRDNARAANSNYIKENTYGTVNDIFEIVLRVAPMDIETRNGLLQAPVDYFITAVNKPFSAIAMHEDELEAVGKPVASNKSARQNPLHMKTKEQSPRDEAPIILDDVASFLE